MRRLWVVLNFIAALTFLPQISHAENFLAPNQALWPGQSIQSANGSYKLVMQADGNLVMYRPNGTTRWWTRVKGEPGAYAVMQWDGNFVQYSPKQAAIWNTGTYGSFLSTLVIQNDGNLVIYSAPPLVKAIWNVGAEFALRPPGQVGDVVGRDLATTGLGFLGHLGMWSGSRVFEVAPPTSSANSVHINTFSAFSEAAPYWGAASYRIPIGNISMYGCWETACPIYNGTVSAEARYSIALRVMNIYLIGADYTTSAAFQRSLPSYNGRPAIRGIYRCDTFIIDALQQSTFFSGQLNSDQMNWENRWQQLNTNARTPSNIFNQLRTFQ